MGERKSGRVEMSFYVYLSSDNTESRRRLRLNTVKVNTRNKSNWHLLFKYMCTPVPKPTQTKATCTHSQNKKNIKKSNA